MQFKIFPFGELPGGKKVPLIDDWETKASNDPNQHQLWQQQYRDRIKGWALPTKANGLFALDIDTKDGRNGFEYLKSQGIALPHVAHQYTPSGGMHLFFRDNPELNLRNTVDRETGIDSRAGGGFVWLYNPNFNLPIAEIPEWVHRITAKKINHIEPGGTVYQIDPVVGQQKLESALDIIRNAQPGERNQKLNTASYLIGQLVAGGAVTYDDAFAQLTYAAQSIGLEPYEIQATSLSGLKGGASHPLTHPFGDKPPQPALVIQAPLPTAVTPPSRWTPRFATVQELLDWSKLKRPQLFEDWSPRDITMTSAIGGVGKSTIKLYEAICLALGDSFLGFKCLNPGRTIFIIGEDTEAKMYAMMGRICKQLGLFESGQEHRLQAVIDGVVIKRARDLALVTFNKTYNNYVPNLESLEKLKQVVEDLNPVQFIFDPIGMFAGPESGGNDSAKALMEFMQMVLDISDASLDMISHIGKDSATRKDTSMFSGRGATSLANHSRVVRTLLKLNDQEYQDLMHEPLTEGLTAIQCFVSKFSDGSPVLDRPFIIIRDGHIFSRKDIPVAAGTDVPGNTARDRQRIFDFVRGSTEARPITQSVVANHFYLQVPKIPKGTTIAIIRDLLFKGDLEIAHHPSELVDGWLVIKGSA